MLFPALCIRRYRPLVILVGEYVGIRDYRVMSSGFLDSVRTFVAQVMLYVRISMIDRYFIVESYDAAVSHNPPYRAIID